jgi:hypothetical protein
MYLPFQINNNNPLIVPITGMNRVMYGVDDVPGTACNHREE